MNMFWKRKTKNADDDVMCAMMSVRSRYDEVCDSKELYDCTLNCAKPILVHYISNGFAEDGVRQYKDYVGELFKDINIRHIYMPSFNKTTTKWINLQMRDANMLNEIVKGIR